MTRPEPAVREEKNKTLSDRSEFGQSVEECAQSVGERAQSVGERAQSVGERARRISAVR